MERHLEVNKISDNLEFFFLPQNADAFYLSARFGLTHGFVACGCFNAHQTIELYIKSILSLTHQKRHGHDLIKLLETYRQQEKYFDDVLKNEEIKSFLDALSAGYKTLRYGEAGSSANIPKIISLLDEVFFNLRHVYVKKIGYKDFKLYVPTEMRGFFLKDQKHFSEKDLSNNTFAKIGFPFI